MNDFHQSHLWWLAAIKILLVAALLLCLIKMPDVSLHFLAVTAHTLYEGLAFLLEEWLTHALDMNKFQAQITVFYASCIIGALTAYRCLIQFPAWLTRLRTRLHQGYAELIADVRIHWDLLPAQRKIQWILVQFACFAASLAFMLA